MNSRLGICVAALTLLSLTVMSFALEAAGGVTAVEYRVALQCSDDTWVASGHFNDAVECRDDSVGPSACSIAHDWCRTHWLIDLNGGDLEDGDHVVFEYFNQYDSFVLSIDPAGGAPLQPRPGHWELGYTAGEEFVIVTLDCEDCSVAEGGRVALRSIESDDYWSAASGGGDVVNVNAPSIGASESFELVVCGSSC